MIYARQLRERYKAILGYVGIITIGVGIMLLIPLLILLAYPQDLVYINDFLIPSAIALIAGFLLKSLLKNKDVILTLHEGGIIVVVSWFIAMILSGIPFMLSGQLNFTQAIFETASGWSTTGLSVIDVTKTANIFLLWRSVMQLFGGAGLAVVMLSAIIGPIGLGLYNAEGRSDKLLPNIQKSTKLIMTIYISYILAGFILYVFAGMPWFDAINHAIAAVSTGGFSTKIQSIGAYNSLPIELITIILMLLGTTNFAAHYLLWKGKIKEFLRVGEVRFMFFLISFVIPIVAFLSLNKLYKSIGKGIRVAVFEFISAISTTGFSTVSYGDWSSFPILMMIVVMIIGGGAGSTAGGVKLYRVYVTLKSLLWNIKRYFLPKRSVREKFVYTPEGKFYIDDKHLVDLSNFITMYMITYVIGVCILVAHGYSLQDSMFEFASSLSTVGLSVGVTSPDAPLMVLWTQIAGMILGRLEFFVLFFASIKVIKDIKFIIKNKVIRQ